MFNLIRNENMKLYKRPRNRIILLAIFVLVSFITFMDWHFSASTLKELKKAAVANSMSIEASTMWYIVRDVFEHAGILLYIFSVIVAGDIVAREFSTGTIKMLMIRPISRTRILLSKYIASLLFALACLGVYFVTVVLVGGLLQGFEGFSTPHITEMASGAVHKTHYLIYLLQDAGYYFVEIGLLVTLAFLVSTVFQSSSMAIGVSSFLLVFNLIFAKILAFKFEWMKYYLFTNTDLSQFTENHSPIISSMTLTSALVTISIYFIAMLAVTWTIFIRRDIRV